MIISLTGFMGSGKSSVARFLSLVLDCECIDLDNLIESEEGKTIHEIFASEGESAFRKTEARILKETLDKKKDAVLALGGGALEDPLSLKAVKDAGNCVFLKASAGTLWNRLHTEGAGNQRPLLENIDLEGFARMLESRSAAYENASCLSVDTEGKGVEEICSEIIRRLLV